jgi:hypothetical protein
MRPGNIDKLIRHLEAQPSDELDRRIDGLVDARPAVVPMGLWTKTRRQRVAGLAVAALVLLAVLIGVPLFNGDGGNVWARALDNARRIGNYSFRRTTSVKSLEAEPAEGDMDTTEDWYVSPEQGVYIECHVGGEVGYDYRSYHLYDSNEVITVYPATQEYERWRGVALQRMGAPREAALWLLQDDYVQLGTRTVDGRVLTGIGNRRMPKWAAPDIAEWHEEIWFDAQTMLLAANERSVVSRDPNRLYVTRQEQFRYGVEFPPRLFAPDLAGYTPTIVNGLRLFAELADGTYPWSLDESSIRQKLGTRAQVEEAIAARQPPSGRYGYEGLMRAARFAITARLSRDFAYFGNRVTPEDGNLVLMYWGDPERDYQVLWGDLRLETLSKDQLIARCYVAGDSGCLLDFLEKDDGTRVPALAADLGGMGDRSVIPALLRHADQWEGPPADNPFLPAIEAIRRREQQRNPSEDCVTGRLVYVNGRAVTRGWIRMDARTEHADQDGYFAIVVPQGDSRTPHLGYADTRFGAVARLFFWTKGEQPDSLTIVLEWASTVRGRVLDEDGTPRGGVSVGLTAHPGEGAGESWPSGSRTKTDAEGRFVFENVPVGAPLELLVENPARTGGPLRVRLADIIPDEKRDLGDIVVRDPAR